MADSPLLLECARAKLGIPLGRGQSEIVEQIDQGIAIRVGRGGDAMTLLQLASSQQVDGVVVCHAKQPGQQSTPRWLVRRRLAPQLEEGFLDHFFRGRAIAQQTHGQGVHAAAVAFVEQFEGSGVAASD
jgi:hypothetical protein